MECPNCRGEIAARDVDTAARLARCTECDRGYRLRTGGGLSQFDAPDGWWIRERDDGFEIRRRWRRKTGVVLLVFGLFWNGIIGTMAFMIFRPSTPGAVIGVMGCGLAPFTLIGLAFVYTAVAYLWNTTVYRVDGDRFRADHGPLPWPWGASLDLSAVEQFYGKEQKHDRRQWFQLRAVESSGGEQKAVGKLERGEAAYLERVLEDRLGIVDREVGGGMEPPLAAQREDSDRGIGERLECPECGRRLSAEEVDVDAGRATCEACGERVAGPDASEGGWEEGEVPAPSDWEVEEGRDGVEMARPWSRLKGVAMAGFSLIWIGAAAGLLFAGVAATESGSWAESVMGLAIIGGIGLGLLYAGVAHLINRTVMRIDDRGLERTYGPLPWRGGGAVPASEIEGVRCEERTKKHDDDIHYRYVAVLELADGSESDWCTSGSENESLFVQQRIERRLGLSDDAESLEEPDAEARW